MSEMFNYLGYLWRTAFQGLKDPRPQGLLVIRNKKQNIKEITLLHRSF